MKCIGIITINDNTNYGNRLQNYAMQELLKEFATQVFTIRNTQYRDLFYLKEHKILYLKVALSRFLRLFNEKIEWENNLEKSEDILIEQRKKAFEEFNNRYIDFFEKGIESEYVSRKIKRDFDYFITGSDQVWNPSYWIGKHTMYLRFAPKKKRIAVAASFGMDEIPKKERKIVAHYLKGMKYISVREESGKKIVKDLSAKECDVIMDPTLLVSAFVWKPVLCQASIDLPKHYLLAYFLGNVSNERRRYIENIAQKKRVEVIWMNDKCDIETYQWGPENFVKAIHDCDVFFTDSFHGCVFSILFHRQFFVFRREGSQRNMFGRLTSLLKTFDLESQIVNDNNENLEEKWISNEKFANVDEFLEKERAKTERILKVVLG